MRFIAMILLGTFLALQGCAPDVPLVTDKAGTGLPYTTVIASGSREGYYLNAHLSLFAPDLINPLQMQLRVKIAVPSQLVNGTWTLRSHGGSIIVDWLQFSGCQGSSPGLGVATAGLGLRPEGEPQVIGVLDLDSDTPAAFQEEDRWLLEDVAGALTQAWLRFHGMGTTVR